MSGIHQSPFDAFDDELDSTTREVTTNTIKAALKSGEARKDLTDRIVRQTSLSPAKADFLIRVSIDRYNSSISNRYNIVLGLIGALAIYSFFHSWDLLTTVAPSCIAIIVLLSIAKQKSLYQ